MDKKSINIVVGLMLFIGFATLMLSGVVQKGFESFFSQMSPKDSTNQVSKMSEKIIDSQECEAFKNNLLNLGHLPVGKGSTAMAIQKSWSEVKAANCVKQT